MPLEPRTIESIVFLLAGAALLLYGISRAVRTRQYPMQALAAMCMADLGLVLTGFGSGGADGVAGGALVLMYNGLARMAAWYCLVRLGAEAKGNTLDALRGVGRSSPVIAAVFAFSMFAALEISPFLTSDGRLFIVHATLGTGQVIIPVLLTAANAALVVLTILIVHPIWLESGPYEKRPLTIESENSIAVGFGCALVLFGLFAETIAHGVAVSFSLSPDMLPAIHFDWHASTWLPFVGALLCWCAGKVSAHVRNGIAITSMVLAFLSVGLNSDLYPLGRLFAFVCTGIGSLVVIYSCGYIKHDESLSTDSYFFFLLMLFASLSGLATASNLGAFFIFWEMMTFSSYVLVAYEGTEAAHKSAIKYCIMCSVSAAVMLPGLLLLPTLLDSMEFADLASNAVTLGGFAAFGISLLVLVGFGVKAGLVPGHSWLPEAHPAAPSSISAPLSGVLTKAGVIGLVQVLFVVLGVGVLGGTGAAVTAETGIPLIGLIVSFLGFATFVYGEIMALRQTDIKRLFAYSTMGQVGEITLTLGLCGYLATTGALFHLVNHAIMKDLLFFASGLFILRAGTRELDGLKGLGRVMPFTATCMVIGLLSILGLPPFAGFMSKFLMVYSIAAVSPTAAALMLLASMAGVVYYMRVLRVLLFEPYTGPKVKDAPPAFAIPLGILAFCCVFFGLFPGIGLSLAGEVADFLATSGKIALQQLPVMDIEWQPASFVLIFGAIVPYLFRRNPYTAGRAAAWVMVLATGLAMHFAWNLDSLSFMMAVAVPAFGAINLFYATGYMDHSHTQWRFYVFFLMMAGGLVGVVTSVDLFNFFLFWEIMSSWSLYFVIVHEENEASLREGYKYFFFNVLGACFLFLGVVLVINWSGGAGFDTICQALGTLEPWQLVLAFLTLGTGFVMKAAQLPFRIDIQMHPATAPTPVSGYISSVLLKSAIFGLVKLFIVLGGAGLLGANVFSQGFWMGATVWVGGITIVMAALFAMFQDDLKLVFIYSTVSQIGYMVAGVALGTSLGVAGGLLHLFNHMIFKDLLFLVAGAVLIRTHKHSINSMGGLAHRMPVTTALFAIGALCVVGVPPSNGFTSKWIIYHALMEQGYVLVAIMSLAGSVITLAYIAKVLHTVYLGQPGPGMATAKEAPTSMLVPMIALAVATVATSVFPGILLAPVNNVLAELSLEPLNIAFWGIVSGRGAWNATATAVLASAALFFGRAILLSFKEKERRSPVHVCGNAHKELNLRATGRDLYTAPADLLRQLFRRFR